MNVTIIICK